MKSTPPLACFYDFAAIIQSIKAQDLLNWVNYWSGGHEEWEL